MPTIQIDANVSFEDTEILFYVECINNSGMEHRLSKGSNYNVVEETAHYYFIEHYSNEPKIRAYSKSRFEKVG